MAQITYKHIYDLITEAKNNGLTPIELSFDENIQAPDCVYNHRLGYYELCPIREPIITIRFREK